jgi:hypothetical protein
MQKRGADPQSGNDRSHQYPARDRFSIRRPAGATAGTTADAAHMTPTLARSTAPPGGLPGFGAFPIAAVALRHCFIIYGQYTLGIELPRAGASRFSG